MFRCYHWCFARIIDALLLALIPNSWQGLVTLCVLSPGLITYAYQPNYPIYILTQKSGQLHIFNWIDEYSFWIKTRWTNKTEMLNQELNEEENQDDPFIFVRFLFDFCMCADILFRLIFQFNLVPNRVSLFAPSLDPLRIRSSPRRQGQRHGHGERWLWDGEHVAGHDHRPHNLRLHD